MSTAEKFLSCLDKVKPTGRGKWMACCPAHDDNTPSLSIKETEGGDLLLHCFAGCSAADVVAAVGFTLSDLFDAPPDHHKRGGDWRPTMPAADLLRSLAKDAMLVGVIATNMNDFGEISDEDRASLVAAIARIDSALIMGGIKR